EKSEFAREYLGNDFVDHYTATRRWEVKEYEKAVTNWDRRRYLELILAGLPACLYCSILSILPRSSHALRGSSVPVASPPRPSNTGGVARPGAVSLYNAADCHALVRPSCASPQKDRRAFPVPAARCAHL